MLVLLVTFHKETFSRYSNWISKFNLFQQMNLIVEIIEQELACE